MSRQEVHLQGDENENLVQIDFINLVQIPGSLMPGAFSRQNHLNSRCMKSLKCDYFETPLQSTWGHEGELYS